MPPDPAPPSARSVDDLRALVVAIGRGDAGVSLGGKAHAVLADLVARPDEVALRTITELAEDAGVSPSTLTRLATRLGFAGFGEFQAVFRDRLAAGGRRFYTRQAHRLLEDAAADDPKTARGVVAKLAHESIGNIDAFVAELDEGELAKAARLLARAPRVRLHALRQMHSLASYLAYALGMLRAEVSLLDGPGLAVAESLAQMAAGDALIVASVAPYTRAVVDAARVAAAAGIRVVALTDTRASPLVPPARHAFFLPHASSFISNGMGAYFVFGEGLVNLVARELGDRALAALARRERFIGDLGVETG